jgi:acyl dehydratase
LQADLPPTPTWDDVDVGRVVPGTPLRLDATTTVLQVSGSQDWNLIHHDATFARDSGHDDLLYNTGWTSATLARVVTDWIGCDGWLVRLEIRMAKTNGPGESIQANAKVVRKYEEEGARLLDLDLWIDNDAKGTTTTGVATVRLP